MTTKLAIAIDLDELRRLMEKFVASLTDEDIAYKYEWRFEHFLLWLRRKRQEQSSQHVADTHTPPTLKQPVGGTPITKLNDGKRRG